MRISTSQIFQSGSSRLMDGQSNLYKLQNQLSTGKKFLSAQDDPVAAAQALITSHALGVNTQYADNQANAYNQLGLEETRMESLVNSIQYIMEQTLAGANDLLTDNERKFFAVDLQNQFEFLLGTANSMDANGYYLFSGYKGETQPFQRQSDGSIKYLGDDGQRLLQVGSMRQIAVSDSGRAMFESIRTGNGTFTMEAPTTNTGTGILDNGTLTSILAWTGDDYQIEFTTPTLNPPQSEYTVTNLTTGVVSPPVLYTPGTAITGIPGISLTITGAPDIGDTFNIAPSKEQSIFVTLQNLINSFSNPIQNNPAARAQARNTINAEMDNLKLALANVSGMQASIGARRHELNELTDVSSMLDIQYKERLSNLEDIDWAEIISNFTQQQTQLDAAQSSFAKISSLSLFNYLR